MTTDIEGLSFCLIRCLSKIISLSGQELTNEFDCPLIKLEDKLETVLSSRIYCIVNIVHECTETKLWYVGYPCTCANQIQE